MGCYQIGPTSYDYCLTSQEVSKINRDAKAKGWTKVRARCYTYQWRGYTFLRSYYTVAAYTDPLGKLHRLWPGWSATTSKQITDALHHAVSKADWLAMPLDTDIAVDYASGCIYVPATGEIIKQGV